MAPVRAYRIALPASDLQRSRAFYEQVLGMDADDTVPSRLYFHCGEFIVAVIDMSSRPADVHPLPGDLYVATGELDEVFRRAVAAGAAITSAIEVRPWGERSFYCADPDGYRLCFVDESTLFLGHGAEWR
jgi:catechol 2,3-dioxygenase-like lactoylglutathione lyase family enzyme